MHCMYLRERKSLSLLSLQTIPAERRASWRIHRVGPGDTMESIARALQHACEQHRFTEQSNDAEVGSVLIIPTASQLERMKTSPKKSLRKASAKGSVEVCGQARGTERKELEASGLAPHGFSICQQRRSKLNPPLQT